MHLYIQILWHKSGDAASPSAPPLPTALLLFYWYLCCSAGHSEAGWLRWGEHHTHTHWFWQARVWERIFWYVPPGYTFPTGWPANTSSAARQLRREPFMVKKKKKRLSSLNKNASCTICMFYTLTCFTKRYVSKVIVQDLQSRHVWHFFCNCWLSADQGDGITKKTFNAAKRNEIASFRSEFFTPKK